MHRGQRGFSDGGPTRCPRARRRRGRADRRQGQEITYERLYAVAVGMLGIAPSDFELMTLAEFDAAEQGFMRRREYDFRTAMNIQRWGSFAIMSSMCDMKGRGMEEVLPLPWDKAPGRRSSTGERKITKREMARMRAEALRDIEKLERHGKKNSGTAD